MQMHKRGLVSMHILLKHGGESKRLSLITHDGPVRHLMGHGIASGLLLRGGPPGHVLFGGVPLDIGHSRRAPPPARQNGFNDAP
eukprot:4734125-Alexandrium_andersonii.AAC.1